jgi:hypothetical protein
LQLVRGHGGSKGVGQSLKGGAGQRGQSKGDGTHTHTIRVLLHTCAWHTDGRKRCEARREQVCVCVAIAFSITTENKMYADREGKQRHVGVVQCRGSPGTRSTRQPLCVHVRGRGQEKEEEKARRKVMNLRGDHTGQTAGRKSSHWNDVRTSRVTFCLKFHIRPREANFVPTACMPKTRPKTFFSRFQIKSSKTRTK